MTTLADIEALPQDILKPVDIADFLGTSQNTINCAAKAGTLPFAYKLGKRTVIPKKAFVSYHKFGLTINKDIH